MFICELDALTSQQRQRHSDLSQKLRPMVDDFQELHDGYAALINSSERLESEIQEFLSLEKLCCPFFTLRFDVEPGHANEDRTYSIRITGPGDIKPFIRAEFGIPEPGSVD